MSWQEFRKSYPRLVEEYADEILRKNLDVIRRMVAAIRRHKAHGNVGISMCIKPKSKEITQWAYGFGGQPILYCEPDEEPFTIYFRVPNPFVSRREVAESIAESLITEELLMHEAPLE